MGGCVTRGVELEGFQSRDVLGRRIRLGKGSGLKFCVGFDRFVPKAFFKDHRGEVSVASLFTG